ncbi:MAG: ferrous iron transport protein B [Phycisphaerae bacterium]
MGRIGAVVEKEGAGDSHRPPSEAGAGAIFIVGNPNVGKSALFNRLTGRYVTVSNYPGTTVEVSRGRSRLLDAEVIDTPGMYSLLPITDEERVARSILLRRTPAAVVHVIDAKSIERMLGLTLQLVEAGLPVVLALNMWDEAQEAGIRIDCAALEKALGIPVVPTVATSGKGLAELAGRIRSDCGMRNAECGLPGSQSAPPGIRNPHSAFRNSFKVDYGPVIEKAIAAIQPHVGDGDGIGRRTRAILLIHGDHEMRQLLREEAGDDHAAAVSGLVWDVTMALRHTPHYHTAMAVKGRVDRILKDTAVLPPRRSHTLRDRLSELCMSPWTGLPLLFAVLYLGLYKFVGGLGAGVMVNGLEGLFKDYVSGWIDRTAAATIPWPILRDLFGGDYGIITLGLRYAIAIVFPIVGTFFLAFSILEDSGYLPRLAMLVDRVFKRIGLNGRAVIPMVLGFGCDTMATMVTRTLETRRERVIATFLLALAVPCSAQIGVILGLLEGHPAAMAVWAGVIAAVFLAAGLLAAKFMPGERPAFYMELPPLRLPRVGNVLVKTYTRMVWYFKEVLPLFIIASAIIWVCRLDWWGLLPEGGVFQIVINGLTPIVKALGLPGQAAQAFLFGFFRRDYGIAGLYDLHTKDLLMGNQLVVAAVTLTLFLPCIAQFLVMRKERGLRMTLLVSAFIAVFAFGVGFVLNLALDALGNLGIHL